jgi:complement component 1 Q subcomponent-binding protein
MKSFIKTSFKALASAQARNVTRNAVQFRTFALAKKQVEAPILSLPDLLTQEIEHEAAEEEIDQEYLDAKELILKTFTLTEEPHVGIVSLERTYNSEVITVKFDIQNVSDDEEQDYDEESEGQEEGEEQRSYGINYEIEVKKGEESLVFDCVAGETNKIRAVQFFKNKDLDDTDVYGGPNFDDLEPAVQDGFTSYLEDRKIDDDLSFFILAHSREKEQREYVNWLTGILNFTSKK